MNIPHAPGLATPERRGRVFGLAPRPLTFSVVVEWDNARLSELRRAASMLATLAGQIAQLDRARFALQHVVIAYDRNHVDGARVERMAASALAPSLKPDQLRVLPTDGLSYYQLKNFGARHCGGEVVAFLDSDTIPEDAWLKKMLAPFRNPQIRVVAGTSYIEPKGIYGKAVALWWFFPLRGESEGLATTSRFFANNVAFRRQLFLATGFPDMPTFRGQCVVLARRLGRSRIRIFWRCDARAAHPAPNGVRHFVCRALCAGHDTALLLDLPRRPDAATWRASCQRLMQGVRDARARIRSNRGRVRLGRFGAPLALALAVAYYALKLVGERVALRRPALIRRYFPV